MPRVIKTINIEEDKVSVIDENGTELVKEPDPVSIEVVERTTTDIEEVPKAKPKRAPRAKPKKEELNTIEPVVEPVVVVPP